jgi:hypothetical protein
MLAIDAIPRQYNENLLKFNFETINANLLCKRDLCKFTFSEGLCVILKHYFCSKYIIMKTKNQNKLILTVFLIFFIFFQSFSQQIDWGKKKSAVYGILQDDNRYSNIVSDECSKFNNLLSGACNSVISAWHSDGYREYFIFDNEQYYFANIMVQNNSIMPDGKTLYQTMENIWDIGSDKVSANKWIDNKNGLYKSIISMRMLEANKFLLAIECVKK